MVETVKTLAPNQAVVKESNGSETFFSYGKKIAKKTKKGRVINKRYYKYSNTTTKYTAKFFGYDSAKDLHEAVKMGRIKLVSNI